MLKYLAKKAIYSLGWDIRRKPDPALPILNPMKLDEHDIHFWITNQHTKRWWHRPELRLNGELQMLKKLCKPGDVVFDVGAHHGMFSVAFSLWTGATGHVYGFEANPENTITLQANAFANNLTNCSCYFTAVGERTGNVLIAGESATARDSEGRETPMISLDDFYSTHQINKVDLIKIDVEGFEYQVLKGAQQLLAKHPKLAIEIHQDHLPLYGASTQQIFELLELEKYHASMVIRQKSWEQIVEISRIEDLPKEGIVNIFLEPKASDIVK